MRFFSGGPPRSRTVPCEGCNTPSASRSRVVLPPPLGPMMPTKSPVLTVRETFNTGDFVGIIGPNGGGKTTLLRLALGVLQPSQGTVRLLGGPPEKNRIRAGY